MQAEVLLGESESEKEVQIAVQAHSETGMNTPNGSDITRLVIKECLNLSCFQIDTVFACHLVDILCTGIGIDIKRTSLALTQMEISAIIQGGVHCVQITGNVKEGIVIAAHQSKCPFVVYHHTAGNPVIGIPKSIDSTRRDFGPQVLTYSRCSGHNLPAIGLGMGLGSRQRKEGAEQKEKKASHNRG